MSGQSTTSAHSHPYTANDNDDESDDGHIFAYAPPSTSEHPSQPHQIQYSQHQLKRQYHQQQDKSQYQHLYAVQLHNLISAAGLSTSSFAPPPLPSVMPSIPEFPTAPNSHSSHAQDHHHHDSDNRRSYHEHYKYHPHPPETPSSDEYEPGPNPYLMRPIPVSPGLLEAQHTNPTLNTISYAHILAGGHLQVVLPTTANSNTSSVLSPAQLKRISSDSNASALELGSQDVTMSYKLTEMGPAEEEEDSPYAERTRPTPKYAPASVT